MRLNPIMKEVVKKEIIKWLDAGNIYSISDSSWVSPIQYVPKKGGVTIISNDNNELIPTRTIMGWRVCMDYRKLNKHCMMAIFSDMVENFLEVFIDNFSVFGNDFEDYLKNLELVLCRYEETNLVLNWEKYHFMVREGYCARA
ncbi:uncharacterized protein LOC105781480 [Gossypium raimondii]|uniref:uncharacterized protein LOC105781480 n=1 Tax=Gossypium raimondii TaxID=29730 RepID=UPI00063B078D|nr:uncharacterized protein LOC105781480 [Gossypium raimondii]